MRIKSTAAPLAALTLAVALAACGAPEDREGGVSGDAAEITEDGPEIGARTDADVAGAPIEQGMRWYYKPATQTVLWGSSDSEGRISLSCNESMTGKTVFDFQWIAEATPGARETVAVTSAEASEAIEVRGVASALGPDAIWQGGIQRGAEVIAMLAEARQPVTFTLGDSSVTTQPSDDFRRVFAACTT